MPSCDTLPSSSQHGDKDVTILDNPTTSSPSQEVLSTHLLQAAAFDREAEREQRRKNGNVSPREHKPGGKNLDPTCLRLAIERSATTKGGKATTHYWCISCDKFRANNVHDRAFEHAEQCNVSIYSNLCILRDANKLCYTY